MTQQQTQVSIPASNPVKVVIEQFKLIVQVHTNYAINNASSSYTLYFNKGFAPIPPNGDPLGLVSHIIGQALRRDSGITTISVESHTLQLLASPAVTMDEVCALAKRAVLATGLSFTIK